MRPLFAPLLVLAVTLRAAEPARTYPLWDGKESVAAYAAKVHLPPTKTIDLGKGVTLDLVLIPAGQFTMGTPEPRPPAFTPGSAEWMFTIGATLLIAFGSVLIGRKLQGKKVSFSLRYLMIMTACGGLCAGGIARFDLAVEESKRFGAEMTVYQQVPDSEKPAHLVTITRPFYMGKYTITQAQYEVVAGCNRSKFKGAQLPVETVCWDEAVAFCTKLDTLTQDKALTAQLPSEAQWEYSCRAGTQTTYFSGDQETDLDAVAWYFRNSGNKPHPVGAKKPNAFGLYDMHGNVMQWCQDWYVAEDSTYLPTNVPRGPQTGVARVLRGGSWLGNPVHCRSARRSYDTPDYRGSNIGFRIVVSLDF